MKKEFGFGISNIINNTDKYFVQLDRYFGLVGRDDALKIKAIVDSYDSIDYSPFGVWQQIKPQGDNLIKENQTYKLFGDIHNIQEYQPIDILGYATKKLSRLNKRIRLQDLEESKKTLAERLFYYKMKKIHGHKGDYWYLFITDEFLPDHTDEIADIWAKAVKQPQEV